MLTSALPPLSFHIQLHRPLCPPYRVLALEQGGHGQGSRRLATSSRAASPPHPGPRQSLPSRQVPRAGSHAIVDPAPIAIVQRFGQHEVSLGEQEFGRSFLPRTALTLLPLPRRSTHPLAREARFSLVLLGLQVLESSRLEAVLELKLRDRLFDVAFSWFAARPQSVPFSSLTLLGQPLIISLSLCGQVVVRK